jgi:hypothetical protein
MADDATPDAPAGPIKDTNVLERLAELRLLLEQSAATYRLIRGDVGFPSREAARYAWKRLRAQQLGILTEMRLLLETDW